MAARQTFVRPVGAWWRGNPYLLCYLGRELTSVAVGAYAVILLVGLVRLSQGPAAWAGWLEALRSPTSITLHAALLVAFVAHTWTWFAIMPKTMPPVYVGERRLPAGAITGAGLAVALVAWVVVILVARGFA